MGDGISTKSSMVSACPAFKGLKNGSYVFKFDGLTASTASMWATGLTAATVTAAMTCALRIDVGGTTYWIPVVTAITS